MADHAVELVAVGHEIAPPVRPLVDPVAGHHNASEVNAAEVAHPVVVVAGDVDDPHALTRQPEHLLHHVVVRLRPGPTALQLPAVDDVADQEQGLGLDRADEVEQQLGLAAAGPEVDVGDEDRAEAVGNGDVHRRSSGVRRLRARPRLSRLGEADVTNGAGRGSGPAAERLRRARTAWRRGNGGRRRPPPRAPHRGSPPAARLLGRRRR